MTEVYLFTKDELDLTAKQTENLYKKLLCQHGITSIVEVISYKTLKKEYKPFEAKCHILSRFALFLSDDCIRRLLWSHIGKHVYKSKKAPVLVNVRAKNLAKEINKHIQGTTLPVTNKGCCYSVHIGQTGMEAGQISENVIAAANVIAANAPQIWRSVKILHLKTDKSVALPVFTWSHPKSDMIQKETDTERQVVESSPALGRKSKPSTKRSTALQGKRKTLGAPVAQLETLEDGSVSQMTTLLRQSKKSKTPNEKNSEKKQPNPPQKPAAKSSQALKMKKAKKSSKKAPKAPAQELRKGKWLQLS